MPEITLPESVNTEYLIMGVISHLSITKESLMAKVHEVIEDHAPEEITLTAALVMASLDLASEKGEVKGFNEGADAWVPTEKQLKPRSTGLFDPGATYLDYVREGLVSYGEPIH